MRWWQRLLFTLILAPLLWRLGVSYIASQQGSTWAELAQQSVGVLGTVFLVFTVPALVLCLVLLGVDRVLHLLGLDLLTVLTSPLIAFGLADAVLAAAPAEPIEAAAAGGALALAVFYGLTWGLTIREPRRRRVEDPDYAESTTA